MKPNDRNERPKQESDMERDVAAIRRALADEGPNAPPELLDQAVMNLAHRELEKSGRRLSFGWFGAFATASVAVLAVSIWLLREQAPAPTPTADSLQKREIFLGREKDDAAASPAPAAAARVARPMAAEAPPAEPAPALAAPVAAGADRKVAEDPVLVEESGAAFRQADDTDESGEREARPMEPEAWIERLLLLRNSGLDEQLVSEIAAFRQAWPDYPLPPELEN